MREQAASIAIEVEYLSQPEIEDHVKELLWSYRQFYLPDVESDSTPATEYESYMRESGQAWSALEAAFKHQPNFKQDMLQDMSEGAEERIESLLIAWSREINWPVSRKAGFWKSTANSAEESRQQTSRFLQDRYWPFTKVIR